MPEDITIRPYEPGDFDAMARVHDAARRIELHLAGLCGAFIPLSIAAEREGLFDYKVLVALRAGEVVGFAAYDAEELAWLYVDPNRMRQGIGRALVRRVLSDHPARPMALEVLCGNEPARRLYESEGFRVTETLSGHMPGNESFEVRVHRMELA